MLTATTIVIACVLLASIAYAGWPLLALPRVRAAALGAGGSCCVAGGTTILGLLAAGLIGMPGVADRQAAAQEPSTSDAAAAAEPSSASGSGSQGIPAPTPDSPASPATAASDDPQIEAGAEGKVVIPPGRPDWVEAAPRLMGSGTHTLAVSSGPFKRYHDAERSLDMGLKAATDEYIADRLGSTLAPTLLSYDVQTIKQRLVKQPTYPEKVVFSAPVDEMEQIHALLEFGPDFRQELDGRWNQVRATSRLAQMGLFSGAALLLLSSVFGYFRLDNATRGYYTGRLQFMAAAAILAIVGAGAVLARWITWM
jgi:hypothetical protein